MANKIMMKTLTIGNNIYEVVDETARTSINDLKTQINAIDYPVDSVNGKTGAVTLSASDVNAVSKTGDTMTGNLTIEKGTFPTLRLTESDNNKDSTLQFAQGIADLAVVNVKDDGSNYRVLRLVDSEYRSNVAYALSILDVVNGTRNTYNIYHEGNKPTPDDIGAVNKAGDLMQGNLTIDKTSTTESASLTVANAKANISLIAFADGLHGIWDNKKNAMALWATEDNNWHLTGTADNITGTAGVANGGTGATGVVNAANNLFVDSLGHGITIPANADLNNYTTVGNYRCSSSSTGATIANAPASGAFTLKVYSATGTATEAPTTAGYIYFLQFYICIDGRMWYRTIIYNNSTTATYGDWYKIYSGNNQPSAADVTAGIFAGAVVAERSSQTYSSYLLRNTRLATADTNPSYNGEICWTYE